MRIQSNYNELSHYTHKEQCIKHVLWVVTAVALVTAVMHVQSLSWDLPHATGAAKKTKQKKQTKKHHQKREETSVDKDVKKRGPLYNIAGIVKWCDHYGKQYGHSLKNQK